MAMLSGREILPPNNPEGFHQRKGEKINNRCIEIGKAKCQDFITESTCRECDIHILCAAGSVNLFGSTFEKCAFHPKREMKNLRLTGNTLRNCTFHGKYSGCRFGNEEEEDAGKISECDFSQTEVFHLCDFLDGSEIETFQWPKWPHIIVTDIARSAKTWKRLTLPEELRNVQESITLGPPARAVSIYLPALTEDFRYFRELFASQSYIIVK